MASPSPSPSPLPTLFLTEAILKVIGGSIFFFNPTFVLKKHITASPPYATSPAALTMIRLLGTQTIAFSIPLFLASRGDKDSVRSRMIVYWALLAREGCLGAGALVMAFEGLGLGWWGRKGEGKVKVEEIGKSKRRDDGEGREAGKVVKDGLAGESRGRGRGREEDEVLERRKLRRAMWIWVAELAPFVVGRLWIMRYRPEWFE
jgi:hypothetical protein